MLQQQKSEFESQAAAFPARPSSQYCNCDNSVLKTHKIERKEKNIALWTHPQEAFE